MKQTKLWMLHVAVLCLVLGGCTANQKKDQKNGPSLSFLGVGDVHFSDVSFSGRRVVAGQFALDNSSSRF